LLSPKLIQKISPEIKPVLKGAGVTRPFLPIYPDIVEIGLKPLFYPRHNNCPIRQQNDKKHLSHRPLDRI
jgi:hypothetical protein